MAHQSTSNIDESSSTISDSDWESAAESGELDARLNAHLRKTSENTSSSEMTSKGSSTSSGDVISSEDNRTPYQPTIKILKRPSSGTDSSGSGNSGNMSNSRSFKTLEQRQQEYAEARMRILGSADDGGASIAATSKSFPTNGTIQIASNPKPTNNNRSS